MHKKNQRGFILFFVMVMTIITIIYALSIFGSSGSSYRAARSNQYSQSAYYAAQSGIEYALSQDLSDTDSWVKGTEFNDFGGAIKITVNENSETGGYDITSEAVVSGRTRKITVTTSASGTILSWR